MTASMTRSTEPEMLVLVLRLCIRLRVHAHLYMGNTRMTRSTLLKVGREKKCPRKPYLACGLLNATRLHGCNPSCTYTARNCCKIRWALGLDWLRLAVSRRVRRHGGLAAAGDAAGDIHFF